MRFKKPVTQRMTFAVTVENKEKLDELKKEEGIPKSVFINHAIEKQLDRHKKGK